MAAEQTRSLQMIPLTTDDLPVAKQFAEFASGYFIERGMTNQQVALCLTWAAAVLIKKLPPEAREMNVAQHGEMLLNILQLLDGKIPEPSKNPGAPKLN